MTLEHFPPCCNVFSLGAELDSLAAYLYISCSIHCVCMCVFAWPQTRRSCESVITDYRRNRAVWLIRVGRYQHPCSLPQVTCSCSNIIRLSGALWDTFACVFHTVCVCVCVCWRETAREQDSPAWRWNVLYFTALATAIAQRQRCVCVLWTCACPLLFCKVSRCVEVWPDFWKWNKHSVRYHLMLSSTIWLFVCVCFYTVKCSHTWVAYTCYISFLWVEISAVNELTNAWKLWKLSSVYSFTSGTSHTSLCSLVSGSEPESISCWGISRNHSESVHLRQGCRILQNVLNFLLYTLYKNDSHSSFKLPFQFI